MGLGRGDRACILAVVLAMQRAAREAVEGLDPNYVPYLLLVLSL
jgi:hypothetical protein